jgi:PAS domain S-box-containing protein
MTDHRGGDVVAVLEDVGERFDAEEGADGGERAAAELLCELLASTELYSFAWYGKPDVGEGRFEVVTWAGSDASRLPDEVSLANPEAEVFPAGMSFRTGEVETARADDDGVTGWPASVAAVAAFPLVHQGAFYGSVTVHTGRESAFDETELAALRALGASVAEALRGSGQAGSAAESFQQIQAVTNAVTDTIVIYDSEGRYREVLTPEKVRAFTTPEEIRGSSVYDYLPEAAADAIVDCIERSLSSNDVERVEYCFPVAGEQLWYEGQAAPLYPDDLDDDRVAFVARNISDRKDRERELLRYEAVVETVQDMVYVADASGSFTLVTEPFATALGYEREELIGADPTLVFEDDGEVDRFQAAIERLWNGEETSAAIETELVTADGEGLPVEVEVSPLPTDGPFEGTVGVVRDRSELQATKQRLEAHRERFKYLFNNLPDAVVDAVFDDGAAVVESINPAFTETFGYDEGTVVGDSINDYIVPEEHRGEGREIDRASREGLVERELRRQTEDGYRDFLFRALPYEWDDEQRAFGMYTDITDQKQRERRLQVLNRVLRHNMRNDLTAIIAHANRLSETVDDPTVTDLADRLCDLVDDLTAVSNRARSIERLIQRDDDRNPTRRVDEIVAEVVTEFGDQHPDADIRADVAAGDVAIDARLGTALDNLVSNAVVHAGDDPTVAVRAHDDEAAGTVTVEVADDGPGIPVHERDVLVGDEDITSLTHGSGLGLWIVKWLTEACGGTVQFGESDLGGARVTLVFPAAAVAFEE